MLKQIADLCKRIKHAREAARHLRVVEFGESNYYFENEGGAIQAMKQKNSILAEIHERICALEEQLREDLYRLVSEYIYANGEQKAAAMLFKLKHWHPWSYEHLSEVEDILRLKGEELFLRKLPNLMTRASLGLIKDSS